MRNEIKTVIFSKNRACQLDLLLRSMDIKATVIYTFDPEYEKGYVKVRELHPNIEFIKQRDFKIDVLKNIEDFTLFLCDDDICIGDIDDAKKRFKTFKDYRNIACLSLRLSTRYNGAPGWIWFWKRYLHDWGYPMSVSAHIFKKIDIYDIILNGDFDNPNDLEKVLRRNPFIPQLMICLEEAVFINNRANRVQNKYPNSHLDISLKELDQRFLSGERISLEDMKEKAARSKSCFMMEKYEFEKDNRLYN